MWPMLERCFIRTCPLLPALAATARCLFRLDSFLVYMVSEQGAMEVAMVALAAAVMVTATVA